MSDALDLPRLTVSLAERNCDVPFMVVAQAVHLAAIGVAASTGSEPSSQHVERRASMRLAEWRRQHPHSA